MKEWREEKMGKVRQIKDSELDPSYQLAAFLTPTTNNVQREAAAECFEWPWPKLTEEVLQKLDSLKPDHERSKIAALEYLASHSIPIPTTKKTSNPILHLAIVIVIAGLLLLTSGFMKG